MDLSTITNIPEFWGFASAGLALVLAFLPTQLRRVGIEAGDSAMNRLHSAIMSAARAAVAQDLSAKDAAALLMQHLIVSVGDTMDKLQPSPEVLSTIFQGKVGVAAAEMGKAIAANKLPSIASEVERAALEAMASRIKTGRR
jgi:pectin methylesterase-like acyl-CoA thioesterase